MRVAGGPHSPPSRRKGVVLLVVITMLTLFAIVGISFEMYSDSSKSGAVQFRPEVLALAQRTYGLSVGLGGDLRGHHLGDDDLRPYLGRLDELGAEAEGLETRIRTAIARETDGELRSNLEALCRDIACYLSELEFLRWMIEQILADERE